MIKFITRFETSILRAIFKFQSGELYCHPLLPNLLSGKAPMFDLQNKKFRYKPLSRLPLTLQSKFDPETCQEITQKISIMSIYSSEIMEAITFEQFFIGRLKQILKDGQYTEFKPLYAVFDCLSNDQVDDKSKLQAVIQLMLLFYKDHRRLEFMFNHFSNNFYYLNLPLSTPDALRKYLSRKEKKGFPGCLVHGLCNRPSNNRELSPLMKDVLIMLAVSLPTHQSAEIIKENLDHIFVAFPKAVEAGLYSVSAPKIREFLSTGEALSAISFAKDEPTIFRQRITGILRFSRASAPLVKIYVDGYVFQIKYGNQDTGEPDTLTGIFISDDHSDFVISLSIGDVEDTDLLMEAFRDYFIKTNYSLPREIVLDKHAYKMLMKNEKLVSFFERNGILVTPSSNPNRKKIERFFLLFQQRFMTHVIQYIGPGIKATKQKNAHPFRAFLVMLNGHLPSKYDLIPLLRRLVLTNYNNEHNSDTYNRSPKIRFEDTPPNPATAVSNGKEIFPTLFYELHNLQVRGASVLVRKTIKDVCDDFHFYYKREMEFIEKFTGQYVDGYIDKDDFSTIYLYEEGTTKPICTIPEFLVIPVAEFDRSKKNNTDVRTFNRISRELIKAHKDKLNSRKDNVTRALGGRDIYKLTKAAQLKKEESSEEKLRREMGLKEDKPAPRMFHANKSRRKGRHKPTLEEYGITITSTI